MSKLYITNLGRIKKGKLFKKGLALLTAITIAGGVSGCTNEGSNTDNESQISIITSFDADEIKNDGTIDENIFNDLYESYGFMDLIQNNYDLDYFQCFNDKQKESLNECAECLKLYINASDEEMSKKALDKVLKAIEKFYDGKSPVEVMQEVLSYYIPGDIRVSYDNDHLENDYGEVSSISIFKHKVSNDDSVQEGAFDFYKLYMLMCKGTLSNMNGVSGAIYNINNMLHVCGVFTDNPLHEFKDKNNKSYLANKLMLAELITINGAYDVMYDAGIFDNMSVAYLGGEYLDVMVDGLTFSKIFCDVNDEVVNYLVNFIEDDEITCESLKENGLTTLVLGELIHEIYGVELELYVENRENTDYKVI